MDVESPLHLHTLPLDILIDILKSLPDFSSVPPLLLAHRAFNEVWKANFNEISQSIARNAFQPWQDAVNLMLEQLYPRENMIPTELVSVRLSRSDLSQMITNAQYIRDLQVKHDRLKDVWGGPPASESKTELLRFRRAAYRVWLYNLTMELPKCEMMSDVLTIMELIEMQSAGRHFEYREWPGLPDFSTFPPGFVVQSLEWLIRRRIEGFLAHDPDLDVGEVYELKRQYASLNLQDPSVKGKEFEQRVGKLNELEKKWREKVAEESERITEERAKEK